MWATQMDEAITHEKNFRDSVKSLVVQDKRPSDFDDRSGDSSDGEYKEPQPNPAALAIKKKS